MKFKTILLASIFMYSMLNAGIYETVSEKYNEYKEYVKDKANSFQSKSSQSYKYSNSLKDEVFKILNCNDIYDSLVFTSCYRNDFKSSAAVFYVIDGKTVHEKNIEERPNWFDDKRVRSNNRSKFSDYIRTGYDKGHLVPVPFIFSKYGQEKSPNLYVLDS